MNENNKTWIQIMNVLSDAGGTNIQKPSGDPPYIVKAIMPNEEVAREIVKILRSIKGVNGADIDAMRFTM